MKNDLKYPIALSKMTNQIIEANKAFNGKKCNCVCPFCNNEMVAYNNGSIQRAHFRHSFDSNCSSSYETYIHWVTKEVFKEIKIIDLPNLEYGSICINLRRAVIKFCDKEKFPPFVINRIKKDILDEINSKFDDIKIDNVLIECTFENVRVDVVLEIGKQKLFIEPYYKNKIDNEKMLALEKLGYSVVSINLNEFEKNKGDDFTIEELKSFLANDLLSKEWKLHRLSQVSIKNFIKNLEKKIPEFNIPVEESDIIEDRIDKINIEIEKLYSELSKMRVEKNDLENRLKEIKNL